MPYNPTLGTRPEDLAVNRFEPTGDYASSQQFKTLYDRPIAEQMYNLERHVNYTGFSSWLRFMGFEKGCENPSTGHYETPWKEDLVTVDTIVTAAGGAGNQMTISLPASAMYNNATTVSTVAQVASYPIVSDVIEFASGAQARVEEKITTTNPHRLVIKPLMSTVNLDAVVTASNSYAIMYNLHQEGSGLPGMRAPRFVKYQNTFGIIKTRWSATGSEVTNKIYFKTPSGNEGAIDVFVKEDFMRDHERARDGMLLFGQQVNNLSALNSHIGIDVSISGTEGFVPFAKTSGTIDTYTLGSYSLTDLDAVAIILENERASESSNILAWDGPDVHRAREKALLDLLTNDLTPFVDRMVPGYSGFDFNAIADSKAEYDKSFTFGIMAVRTSGFNFAFKKLPVFADIRNAGAAAYKYKNTSIYCPIDMQVNSKGEKMPLVGYEYKTNNKGYNRNLQFGRRAGVGANGYFGELNASDEFDTMTEGLVSELALHASCGNKIVYQENL